MDKCLYVLYKTSYFDGFCDSTILTCSDDFKSALADLDSDRYRKAYIVAYPMYDEIIKYPGSLNTLYYGVIVVMDGETVPDFINEYEDFLYSDEWCTYYKAPSITYKRSMAIRLLTGFIKCEDMYSLMG